MTRRSGSSTDASPGEGESRGELDSEQTLADTDQTVSDLDQTAADADRAAAGRDRESSDRDQRFSDADQRASDRDQETAEHQEAGDVDAVETQRERRFTRAQRAETSAARAETATTRTHTALGRVETAESRDDAATARDAASAARDLAAAARDRLATHSDHGPDASARQSAASDRAAAAEDRAHAADDRAQARADRDQLGHALSEAQFDDLTGTYRRATGTVALRGEVARAHRTGGRLVLAFVDVDALKAHNDREGHASGDTLLMDVVESIRSKLRAYDPVVRFGGDEFVCALFDADLDDARNRFDGIRAALEQVSHSASISVGFAVLEPGDTLEDLITRGDAALYEDKHRT